MQGQTLSFPFVRNNEIITLNQLQSIYKITEEIIDNLDKYALDELLSGGEKDIDNILDIITEEVYKATTCSSGKIKTSSFGYLDRLTTNLDELMRKLIFNYFVLTTLPDFTMNWHHVEWGNLVQLYKYICFIAARDHSKSFTFSKAYPLWKLYRYEPYNPVKKVSSEFTLSKRGMLVTAEYGLSKDFMRMIKEEIEGNDILKEKLLPKNDTGWGQNEIICKNGAGLQIKSIESQLRGRHPGWIVIDDILTDNVLYSLEQRKKFADFFYSNIMNMIIPGGSLVMIGCVNLNTIILLKSGFKKMEDLIQQMEPKQLRNFDNLILDKTSFVSPSKIFFNGETETRIIKTTGSHELECSLIHPLWVMGLDGIPNWKKTSELKVGDWVGLTLGCEEDWGREFSLIEFKKNRFHKINKIHIDLPDYINEDLAYLFGLYIAEGYIDKNNSGVEIATGDEEIFNFLTTLTKYNIKFRFDKPNYLSICTHRELVELFRYLGFYFVKANGKIIPSKLYSLKKSLVIPLLQGIYDGDGSCCSSGGSLSVNLSSTSENLVKYIQHILLMGFGINSHLGVTKKEKIKPTTIRIKGKDYPLNCNFDQYDLSCSGFNAIKFLDQIGFRIKRKQNKLTSEFRLKCIPYFPIPHQKELLTQLKKNRKNYHYPKDIDSKIISLCYDGESVNKYLIEKFVNYYENIAKSEGDCLLQLKKNLSDKSQWVKIIQIEESIALTADFIIPSTNSFISNGFISHNTPFHENDIYAELKEKKSWKVFEYPAIFPDGSILWEERHGLDDLLEKRDTQGSIIFSREILCKPISSESSIFPYETISKSFLGMQDYSLVRNYYSHPKKFVKIGIGCDFAISSEVGADYTVFTVLGLDDLDNYWLLWVYREKGKNYNEQIGALKELHANFNPNVIMAEDNAFQKVLLDIAKESGLPIVGHTTGVNKYDLKNGLPGLAVLFEQCRIRFPRQDSFSRDMTDIIIGELSSITWSDSKKLMSVSEHDDTVMSLWLAIKSLTYVNDNFSFSFI